MVSGKVIMDCDAIRCIFYSEFHDEFGPKAIYQVPEDFISKDDFDMMHAHIITKRELQNHIVSNNILDYKVVGCPMHVELPYKPRNALIFNMCFVFDANVETYLYEMAIKKMGSYLRQLEIELQFLTNKETMKQLPQLMQDILTELNSKGYCHIPITTCTTIHLTVVHERIESPMIRDHDVPVIVNIDSVDLSGLDLATRKLLPLANGVSHIAKIAHQADVEINTVVCCIRYLIERGLVKLIPIFQYSNVYVATAHLQTLLDDRSLLAKCIDFVSFPGYKPSLRVIYELFSAFVAGTTVRDVCNRLCPRSNGVDERKLVHFGMIEGLLRRVQRYPVHPNPDMPTPFTITRADQQRVYKYMDGLHSFDEICCLCGMSCRELEEFVVNDSNIAMIWK